MSFKFIIFFIFNGWSYRSDNFPLITDVLKFKDKLYFVVIEKNSVYIFEKYKNKILGFCYEKEKEEKYLSGCRAPKSEIDSIEKKIKIEGIFGGEGVIFDIEKKCFEVLPKSGYACPLSPKYEFIVDDSLKIELKTERWEKSMFIIHSPKKKEEIPLPPLSFFTFERLRPEHSESHWEYESKKEYARSTTFSYSAADPYLINDKIWFLIDFYTGEGYEGVGGIGYFDYKRKKIGIARIPELLDYAVCASILVDKNIWIAPVIYYEGSSEFPPYLIEFNTLNCKYRVYSFENTLLSNFGVVKISKISKDSICFFTGNEVVILNLKSYDWEKYSIYLKVKKDSTPLFYYGEGIKNKELLSDSLGGANGKIKIFRKVINYAKKNEDFFPVYFPWGIGGTKSYVAEVEVSFKICGECINCKYKEFFEYIKNIKRKPIWDVFEWENWIKVKEGEKFLFFASPIEVLGNIRDSLYNVCVYGAFIDLTDTQLFIKNTGKAKILPPEWKTFSKTPFYSMEEEVERMEKEFEESMKFLYNE